MKRLILIAFLAGCTPEPESIADVRSIAQKMHQQELDWSNGNLDGFLQPYSSEALFSGSSGITVGRQAILERYKRGYPNADSMGKLKFELIDQRPLGPDEIWMVGTWNLYRSKDTLRGGYALLWKKYENGSWQIAADYSH